MHAWMHECMHACMNNCMHACMNDCMHALMIACMHEWMNEHCPTPFLLRERGVFTFWCTILFFDFPSISILSACSTIHLSIWHLVHASMNRNHTPYPMIHFYLLGGNFLHLFNQQSPIFQKEIWFGSIWAHI